MSKKRNKFLKALQSGKTYEDLREDAEQAKAEKPVPTGGKKPFGGLRTGLSFRAPLMAGRMKCLMKGKE